MDQLNQHKIGLTVGFFLGGWHLAWSLLVLTGTAQIVTDFVLWAHMVHVQYTIGPFDILASVTLIAMTFVIGYVAGIVFARLWNWLYR